MRTFNKVLVLTRSISRVVHGEGASQITTRLGDLSTEQVVIPTAIISHIQTLQMLRIVQIFHTQCLVLEAEASEASEGSELSDYSAVQSRHSSANPAFVGRL